MTDDAIASAELIRALRPQTRGEPVNVHVVPATKEPEPDFEQMRRTIEGPQKVSDERENHGVRAEGG